LRFHSMSRRSKNEDDRIRTYSPPPSNATDMSLTTQPHQIGHPRGALFKLDMVRVN